MEGRTRDGAESRQTDGGGDLRRGAIIERSAELSLPLLHALQIAVAKPIQDRLRANSKVVDGDGGGHGNGGDYDAVGRRGKSGRRMWVTLSDPFSLSVAPFSIMCA